MTIQLELDPTLEANLISEAQAHGVDPKSYAQRLIEGALKALPVRRPPLTEADLDAFFEAMKSDVPLPPELLASTFDREMIYSNHD